MINFTSNWDLTTIPDDLLNSESGRRRRAKGPQSTNLKLEPCRWCGALLSARQRRRKCVKCGRTQGFNGGGP